MVAGVMVVTFHCNCNSRLTKFTGKNSLFAVICLYLDAETSVESIVQFGAGCDGRLLTESSGFQHFLVYVLHETGISVCYQIGYLAAGQTQKKELLYLCRLCYALVKNVCNLFVHNVLSFIFRTAKVTLLTRIT